MAVTIAQKSHTERGTYYEVDLSASGDAFQAHIIRDYGYGEIPWYNRVINWYKTASVDASFTNGPPEDMEISSGGNGVTGGGWQAHANTASRQDAEANPLTGLRFKATAASQKVVLWTGVPLQPGLVAEVKGV